MYYSTTPRYNYQSLVPVVQLHLATGRVGPIISLILFLFSFSGSYGQTFNYTGAVQSYTFTNNVCIKIKAWGAGGGIGGSDVAGNGGSGGGGAYAETLLNVNSGDVLQIYTGGGGINGVAGSGGGSGAGGWGYGNGGRGGNAGASGGSGAGAGGGGSSTVLLNGAVILVAAGGGGGGGCGCGSIGANGGGAGEPGLVASPAGSDGPVNPCAAPNGAQGNDRGGGDGGGGGGGGGGWNGGYGGGVTSQGGTDCNYGGGAGGGAGGTSLGTIVTNAVAQTPGNNSDPDLCASCAIGSSVSGTPGGNGLIILIISNITLTSVAGNNGPLCPGATLNLSATAPAITYSWTGPQSFTSSNQNPVIPAVDTTNSGPYSVQVTDTIGCSTTLITNVLVNANPIVSISPPVDTLTCAVTNINLTAPSNAAVPAYDWGGGINTSINNVTQPGVYNVTVTDASTGCTGTATVGVGQNIVAPVASINLPDTLTCAVTAVTLTAVSVTPGATFTWDDGTNSNTDNISSPATYSVTVTDPANGCTGSASATVTQSPVFTDTFSVSPVTCFGQANGSIQVTVNGVAPPFVYNWSNGDNTALISNIATGSYSVTITDQNQCVAVISAIQVPEPQEIAITFADVNETCFNSTDATINTTVTGGIPGYTYLWNDGSILQNRNNLPPGTYNLTVTDNAVCTMSASTVITQPTPLVVTAGTTNPTCSSLPTDGSITVTPSNGTSPYHYLWNNGQTGSGLTNLAPDNYEVTVTDANNCTVDTSFVLNYIFDFTVQTSSSLTIKLGDSTSLGYTVTGNAGTYTGLWSPGNSLGCVTCNVTPATPAQTTLYQIEITDSAGCTASDTVSIYVIPDYPIFIPNVFTPDGDGNNDFFEVFGKKDTWVFFQVQIFDRIGEKVYESNDMHFKWDGTFKGKNLPPSVFVYQVKVVFIDDHSEKLYKGSLSLIK